MNLPPFRARMLLVAAIVALSSTAAQAGHDCCAQCGQRTECKKVCRKVCTTKTVDVTLWACECEDFCVPCHPHCTGDSCKQCGEEACKCTCGPEASHAHVLSRKKLLRKVIQRQIPAVEWKVEYLCHECSCQNAEVHVPAAEMPSNVMPDPSLPPAPPAGEAALPIPPSASARRGAQHPVSPASAIEPESKSRYSRLLEFIK